MAIPAPEYREQLLAQGCAEGLADAIVSLVEAARDDAEAEVIIKVGERVAHSEQQLNGRLDQHTEQNDQQFRDVDSAIRVSARELTDQINQHTAEIKMDIAEIEKRTAKLEEQFADLRVENERRHGEQEKASERRHAEMQDESKQRHAEQEKASERRHAEQEQMLIKQESKNNERHAALLVALAEQESRNEQRYADQKAEIEQQLGEIRIENAEKEAAAERRFNKGQERLLYAAIGLAGLIVGAAAAVIAAVAFLV